MRAVVAIIVAVLAVAAGMMVLVFGTADLAAPTSPPGGSVADVAPLPVTAPVANPAVVRTARILASVPFRVGAGEEAPVVTDEWGEHALLSPVGRQVTVLDLRRAPDSEWARVYVHVDPFEAPGDFYAWLPMEVDGTRVLQLDEPRPCPPALTLEALAALSPFERLACADDLPITLDVRIGFPSDAVSYRTEPVFFGSADQEPLTLSLSAVQEKASLFPAGFGLPTFDAATQPGLEPPPLDFDVRVSGSFASPLALGCRRTSVGLAPAGGLPDEAGADSVAWCRTRFVITSWRMLRGPERRPLVAGDVQLHRSVPGGACGGVGMEGPLTLRIDPSQADAVWVERPDGGPSLAFFDPTVRYQAVPFPALVTGGGLVIRDGATFDPDRGFPGLPSCPGGSVISFGG